MSIWYTGLFSWIYTVNLDSNIELMWKVWPAVCKVIILIITAGRGKLPGWYQYTTADSRLTVSVSDTSTAPLPPRLPLLPGVGLHGNTTAEDHWPLHCRHQSCNKQTWPGHTPRHRHRDQCGIQTMSPHSAGHCKLNQYNLTMDGQLQNLNATLVYFYTDIFFLNRITLPSYTWYLSTKLKVFAN